MTQTHTPKHHLTRDETEISLLDIFRFFKASRKTILSFSAFGLGVAVLYLLFTPNLYQASAQIQMAQIIALSSNNNNINNKSNTNMLGLNIEEPALLISRLGSPASFTQQEVDACGLEGQKSAASTLAKSIKLTPIKNVGNVVELKTIGSTPKVAINCAKAVFELIKVSQAQIVAPYIDQVKAIMADDQKRLATSREIINNAIKSEQAMGVNYISTREEIRFLLEEIARLKDIIASSSVGVARLVTPIYAGDISISPSKHLVLTAGLIGGLFLGILLALVRQVMANLKNEINEAQ